MYVLAVSCKLSMNVIQTHKMMMESWTHQRLNPGQRYYPVPMPQQFDSECTHWDRQSGNDKYCNVRSATGIVSPYLRSRQGRDKRRAVASVRDVFKANGAAYHASVMVFLADVVWLRANTLFLFRMTVQVSYWPRLNVSRHLLSSRSNLPNLWSNKVKRARGHSLPPQPHKENPTHFPLMLKTKQCLSYILMDYRLQLTLSWYNALIFMSAFDCLVVLFPPLPLVLSHALSSWLFWTFSGKGEATD